MHKRKKLKQMAFIHKFSKGNWRKSEQYNLITISNPGVIVSSETICDISDFGKNNTEIKSNQKLIEQAPNLLQFAEMLHDMYVKNEKKPFFFKELQETIEKAGVEITHK